MCPLGSTVLAIMRQPKIPIGPKFWPFPYWQDQQGAPFRVELFQSLQQNYVLIGGNLSSLISCSV
jgi:hypothetical protein